MKLEEQKESVKKVEMPQRLQTVRVREVIGNTGKEDIIKEKRGY